MQSSEWANWVSAAATTAAAVVALAVPFVMKSLDKEHDADVRLKSLTEIWRTIERTVHHYLDVRQAALSANTDQQTRFHQIAVECDAITSTLDRILARSTWESDILVAGCAAVKLAEGTANAARQLVEEQFFAADEIIRTFHHVAQLVNSRNEKVRADNGIERSDGETLPIV